MFGTKIVTNIGWFDTNVPLDGLIVIPFMPVLEEDQFTL